MTIPKSKYIPQNTLNQNDVHIWITVPQIIANLDILNSYRDLLSSDELIRVDRYKFEKDRNNALITRAFVRDLLSKYSGIKAKELVFETGVNGKPELKNSSIPIKFNLSHTKDMIICAITLNNNIGCDVENIHRKIDVKSIAKRYFGENEYKDILSQPEELQKARFFKFWTLKEAFVKSTGDGLAKDLSDITFTIGAPTETFFNKNITLTYKNNKMENCFHCIILPDPDHCLSLSVNASDEKLNISLFKGDPLLHAKDSFHLK